MSDKKTTFAEEVGCVKAIWMLFSLGATAALNGSLWYIVLTHIDAPTFAWVLYCVWIPTQLCMSAIGTFFDWFHKIESGKERRGDDA